ncbi:hypothetical protein JOH51_001077 [Rhizobium leguminosarum]|nr:hypothetical protein [Rhizobium leguminosarum]MBP2443638.1 hypothetical protein [Rhizobium leguminosarum]
MEASIAVKLALIFMALGYCFGAIDDDGGDETHPNDQQAKEHQRGGSRRIMLQG